LDVFFVAWATPVWSIAEHYWAASSLTRSLTHSITHSLFKERIVVVGEGVVKRETRKTTTIVVVVVFLLCVVFLFFHAT
jgi:hypothetical protein